MGEEQKGRQLDSLYLPLILAIPANILLLFRMIAFPGLAWGLVLYAVFTFFLFATGYMSIKRNTSKAKTLGTIYIAAGVIFVILVFFVI